MDAFHRFKEDLVNAALETINAFEHELENGTKQKAQEAQDLLQRIEHLQNENLILRSENQEWIRKYEALNARLMPQLLPESSNDLRNQGSNDQPTLGDFACLLEDNEILRRKLRVARHELKHRERHGLGTPEARCQKPRMGQTFPDDERIQLRSGPQSSAKEIHCIHQGDSDARAEAFHLPPLELTKSIHDVNLADSTRGPPTPVSDSFRDLQAQTLSHSHHDAVPEEPDMNDDETSSETQFSDPREHLGGSATQDNTADDSDMPVIVSERSLKRKRGANNDVNLPSMRASRSDELRSQKLKKVKIELRSSSQCGDTPQLSTYRVNETMDLDEVGSRIKTPKKPRQSLQGTTSPENRPSDSDDRGPEEIFDDNCDRELLHERSQSAPVTRTLARFARVFSDQPSGPRQAIALQPKDANSLLRKVQQKGNPTITPSHKAGRTRRDRRSIAVEIMAEDGETNHIHPNTISAAKGLSNLPSLEPRADDSNATKPVLNQRLEIALNEPPARSPFLTLKAKPEPKRNLATARNSMQNAKQKNLLELLGSASSKANRANLANGVHEYTSPTERIQHPRATASGGPRTISFESTSTRKERQHLRVRSPESLSLGDFVMNPNARMSFAYAEPVRARDQRKCLSTCTKPECCGTRFLKIAQIGGVAPTRSGLWSSSPPNEQEADQVLLLEHLDNDHATLRSMSRTDKVVMLARIRAQHMGDAIGKHKLTGYERAKTPPGFWRADMPSTQEVEEDREEAGKLERQKVQERWHEAMAEDGKGLWRFRDKCRTCM